MSDIKDWSTTAASNNSSSPDGFPEGMPPGDVNNAAREVMASVRVYYDTPEWREWGHTITYGSATTFTTAVGDGDTTAIYHDNRRVRAIGTLTTTIYGRITGAVHTTSTTVTVVWDSGSLSNEALTIALGAAVDQESIGAGAVASFESGTILGGFFQASAPLGWTQTGGQNDKAFRVVSGTGGGTGGTHLMSNPPSGAHSHEGPSHLHTVGSHTHQWYNHNSGGANDASFTSTGADLSLGNTVNTGLKILANTASADKLDQDLYTATSTGDTGLSGTGNTDNGNYVGFAPLYIDVIMCTKD